LSFKPTEETDTLHLSIAFTTPTITSKFGHGAFLMPSSFPVDLYMAKHETKCIYRDMSQQVLQIRSCLDSMMIAPNTNNGIFYKTDNNLPWAMNVASTEYDHVVEYTPILNAYLKFAIWAQTSGGSFNDWYLDKIGYRDPSKIKD
jgi:LruC domain-containing protein